MRRETPASKSAVRVAIVGGGAVGRTLGRLMQRAGHAITEVVCRSEAHARAAVEFIGAGRPSIDATAAARGAQVVLLSVPDDAIEPVARAIRTSALVVHLCGNLPSSVLAPCGGRVGAIHPLRSFADPAAAVESFDGTFCFYEGQEPAELTGLIESWGGRPVPVSAEGKPLYHAGAVFASNYVVALFEAALRLLERAGIPRARAVEPMLGLLGGTAENLRRVGVPAALTGPIARGETGTVSAHLAELQKADPALAELYRALGRLTLELAQSRGLDPEALRRTLR